MVLARFKANRIGESPGGNTNHSAMLKIKNRNEFPYLIDEFLANVGSEKKISSGSQNTYLFTVTQTG